MAFGFLSREFCFWMVPNGAGKVRKVRIKAGAILGVFAAAALLSGLVAFLASDYAQIQMQRARHYLHLKTVSAERDRLATEKQRLEALVGELEDSKFKAATYQQEIQGRVAELASILKSAGSLGLDAPSVTPKREAQEPIEFEGVGGAEIPCSGNRCLELELEQARASLNPVLVSRPVESEDDLLENLDGYIGVLKVFPIGIPVNGYVSSPFGVRASPFSRGKGRHEGLDYNLPRGAQILATGDGVVREVRRCRTYGLVVDIAHSDRVVTRYAHMSKVFVSPGEKICRSEVIGLVGSTGRSTGPHLHYEVRVDGEALDPMRFINLAQRLEQLGVG